MIDTIASDIQCILRLSEFCSVIPLIAKADTLSSDQINKLKSEFLQQARETGLPPFFGASPSEYERASTPYAPFSISSVTTNDDEMMDASVLMNPDYVQPLASSELGYLLDKIFDQDSISWFRSSAAKKLIQSHNSQRTPSRQQAATPVSDLSGFHVSQFNSPFSSISHSQASESPVHASGLSEYALARVADHTRREESLAQIQLAKWATDLQRSLQNERRRYEGLVREERIAWLTERLDECTTEGTLIPIGRASDYQKENGILTVQCPDGHHLRYRIASNMSTQDPLGLIRWNEDLKRRGWMVLQVVGGVSVVGGLAIWLAKALGLMQQDLTSWIRSC